MECAKCGSLIGEPDLSDPNDQGVILEPVKDFDPDPNRMRGMMEHAYKKRSSSKRKRQSKPLKRGPALFPLPLPRQGERVIHN